MAVKPVILIGYSGHGFVVADALLSLGLPIAGYCDTVKKEVNPFALQYLGPESSAGWDPAAFDYFACVGSNAIRRKIIDGVRDAWGEPMKVIHPAARVSAYGSIGAGTLVSAGAVINAMASIGQGGIVNTGAIVEHECQVADYVHIAPGAVLCGDVRVGTMTFVGANSVIAQGLKIGANVLIGAGAVVLRDVPDGARVIGNPGKSATADSTIE